MRPRLLRLSGLVIFFLLVMASLSSGNLLVGNQASHIRRYTRPYEFDYFEWTMDALAIKLAQASLASPHGFNGEARHQVVMDYMDLVNAILNAESQLNLIYSDPDLVDPQAASSQLRSDLEGMYDRASHLTPLAEAVIQEQLDQVLVAFDLAPGGQPVPPVLFHISPLPYQLVVSPREIIQQSANVALARTTNVEQHNALEEAVDAGLNVSSLVVPVGGVGTYPTMVMTTNSLPWLLNVVAHEWTHNYLTLRPLGVYYFASPELRTMNETVASIAGNEISQRLLELFYPEQLAGSSPAPRTIRYAFSVTDPADFPRPVFDFQAEMYETRIRVDELLAIGLVDEAEAYMEQRRVLFWENGYAIRKLNQAYFAFYGSYADIPGGAAGEDPVGPAVRALRLRSTSLKEFLVRITQMTSFEELMLAVSD